MKKIINICLLALSFSLITACDSGFDDMNKSKTGATVLDPAFVLNNGIINASLPSQELIYETAIVQQIIAVNTGVLAGGNVNQVNAANTLAEWAKYYPTVIKYTSDVIAKTKDLSDRNNLLQMARILQAYCYILLTDTYGDIPYTDAGAGYTSGGFFPKYDTQQTVYNGIISELTDACAKLGTAGKVETADVLYAGNVAKWKKFGYSLLLRAGMRLTKADPIKAKATVIAAFNGGVILANADNAVIKHDANYVNGVGGTLNSTESSNYYLAEPFTTALKANSDPRLSSIAIRYPGAATNGDQIPANGTTVASNQYGLTVGKTDNNADAEATALALPPGGAAPLNTSGKRQAFSQLDRNRMGSQFAPMFLVTAAQSNLLLAEAVTLLYIPPAPSTAAQYFDAGIKAHCDQLVSYNAGSAVLAADRDAYALSRVVPFGTNALKEIGYEYWIASFLNGPEAWANFRRTGFPALLPNPNPGSLTPGGFINRLTYPSTEIAVNLANVTDAITSIGGDELKTKVWWAK